MRLLKLCATIAMMLALATSAFAGKLDDVKAKGELVVGVKDSTPPFGYVDEQSKQLVGFDVDVAKYIADKLGVKLVTKPVTSSTRIPLLTQGSVDMIAATMTHKAEREDVIDFSITYLMDGQKILVKKNSGIKSIKDLAGKKIGTTKGSTSEKNAAAAQPQAQILSFDDYPQAFLALQQGKVQAVTTDSSILVGLQAKAENPAEYAIVGDAFSLEPYGIGVPQNDSKFRNFVNKCLIEMWTSGEYKKAYDKWMGPETKYYLPLTWQMDIWPL